MRKLRSGRVYNSEAPLVRRSYRSRRSTAEQPRERVPSPIPDLEPLELPPFANLPEEPPNEEVDVVEIPEDIPDLAVFDPALVERVDATVEITTQDQMYEVFRQIFNIDPTWTAVLMLKWYTWVPKFR